MANDTLEQMEQMEQVDEMQQLDTSELRKQMRQMRADRKLVQQTLEQAKAQVKELNHAIRARLDIVRTRISEEKAMRDAGITPPRKKRGPRSQRAPEGAGEELVREAVGAARTDEPVD